MKKVMKDIYLKLMFKLHLLHNEIPFLLERIKIGKTENFVANLHDKTAHVIHITNLKQELNHRLVL